MITFKTNTAIVKILIPIAYLSEKYRIQEATLGPRNRVYVTIGSSGGRSISIKSVKILACGVMFYPKSHFNNDFS